MLTKSIINQHMQALTCTLEDLKKNEYPLIKGDCAHIDKCNCHPKLIELDP